MNYLPQRPAPYRAALRPATKRRKQSHPAIKTAAVVGIAFVAGFVFPPRVVHDTTQAINEAAQPGASIIEQAEPTGMEEVVTAPLLLGGTIPLDADIQADIWEMCGQDRRLFCTIMAIAKKESQFDMEAVGDGGESIGLMQINTRWQADRIEALGVTDLTDYRQNVAVALDYIAWIAERLSPEAPEMVYGSNALFMAYNSGYAGTQKLWERGVYETEYSAECLGYFQTFMGEAEVAK